MRCRCWTWTASRSSADRTCHTGCAAARSVAGADRGHDRCGVRLFGASVAARMIVATAVLHPMWLRRYGTKTHALLPHGRQPAGVLDSNRDTAGRSVVRIVLRQQSSRPTTAGRAQPARCKLAAYGRAELGSACPTVHLCFARAAHAHSADNHDARCRCHHAALASRPLSAWRHPRRVAGAAGILAAFAFALAWLIR